MSRTLGKQIDSLNQEEREFYWVLDFLGMFNTNYVKWSITIPRVQEFLECYKSELNGGAAVITKDLNNPGISQKTRDALSYFWEDLVSNAKSNTSNTLNIKRIQFIESVRMSGIKDKNGNSLADLMYDFVKKCKAQKIKIVCDGIMPRSDVWSSETYLWSAEELFDTEQIDGNINVLASLCNSRSTRYTKAEVYVGDYNHYSIDAELTNELHEIAEALQYDIYAQGAKYYDNVFYKFVGYCCQGRFNVYTGVIARILSQTFSGFGKDLQAFANIVYGWYKFYNLPVKNSEYQKPITDEQRVQAICPPQEIRLILLIYDYVVSGKHLLIRQTITKHQGLFFSKKEVQYKIVADLRFWTLLKVKDIYDDDPRVTQGMQCLRERLFSNRKDLQLYVTDDQLTREAIANPYKIDSIEAMYNDLDSDFIRYLKALPKNGFLYNYIKKNILAYSS